MTETGDDTRRTWGAHGVTAHGWLTSASAAIPGARYTAVFRGDREIRRWLEFIIDAGEQPTSLEFSRRQSVVPALPEHTLSTLTVDVHPGYKLGAALLEVRDGPGHSSSWWTTLGNVDDAEQIETVPVDVRLRYDSHNEAQTLLPRKTWVTWESLSTAIVEWASDETYPPKSVAWEPVDAPEAWS